MGGLSTLLPLQTEALGGVPPPPSNGQCVCLVATPPSSLLIYMCTYFFALGVGKGAIAGEITNFFVANGTKGAKRVKRRMVEQQEMPLFGGITSENGRLIIWDYEYLRPQRTITTDENRNFGFLICKDSFFTLEIMTLTHILLLLLSPALALDQANNAEIGAICL
uniref:Uncharacterized protein n=1 Tax=Ditylenchus dipsaci TaxID=166011 RepID=A0A915ETI4_9BILA